MPGPAQVNFAAYGNQCEPRWIELLIEQEAYGFCQRQIADCDRRLEQYLQQLQDRTQGVSLQEEKRKERLRKKKGNKPQFNSQAELFRVTGTDLTQIDGIDVITATCSMTAA